MGLTIDIQVIHSSEIGLSLAPNKPYTVRLSAIALLRLVTARTQKLGTCLGEPDVPVAIDIVIKRELLVHLDITLGKYSHP